MKLRLIKILLLSLAAYASMTTLGSELPDESLQDASLGSDAAAGPSAAAAGPSEEAGETKAATNPIGLLPSDQLQEMSEILGRREVASGAWALGRPFLEADKARLRREVNSISPAEFIRELIRRNAEAASC